MAVDFSDGMLGELRQAVAEAGVGGSLLHLPSRMAGELGRHHDGLHAGDALGRPLLEAVLAAPARMST